MTIALYGGKFDPPHKGHLNVALQILKKVPGVDELWLIPAKTHRWREIYTPGKDRVAMLETFKKYDPRIKVSDIELKRNKPTSTFDTVNELKILYPQHNFLFIMGSDNLATFNKWHKFKELPRLVKFVIYPRSGFNSSKLPKNFSKIPNLKIEKTSFSSTSVRRLLHRGKNASAFLTPEITRYINQKHLHFFSP